LPLTRRRSQVRGLQRPRKTPGERRARPPSRSSCSSRPRTIPESSGGDVRGSIRTKVPGKVYELRVALGKDPITGRYRQKSVTVRGSRAEAQRALRRLLDDVETGHNRQAAGGSRTFGELLDDWLAFKSKRIHGQSDGLSNGLSRNRPRSCFDPDRTLTNGSRRGCGERHISGHVGTFGPICHRFFVRRIGAGTSEVCDARWAYAGGACVRVCSVRRMRLGLRDWRGFGSVRALLLPGPARRPRCPVPDVSVQLRHRRQQLPVW
jgi:hypothetical protein